MGFGFLKILDRFLGAPCSNEDESISGVPSFMERNIVSHTATEGRATG